MRRWAWVLAAWAVACSDSGSDSTTDTPDPSCTVDADCPDGFACASEGLCVDGSCDVDADCGDARQVCTEGACTFLPPFGDECDDADRRCPFGEFCSALLGTCESSATSLDCVRTSQCPSGQICDRSASKCIVNPGCFGPDFCEPTEICNAATRVCEVDNLVLCQPCATADQCSEGQRCDDDTGACVPTDEQTPCATGTFCSVLEFCVQCESDADCGDGLFCNLDLGTCDSEVQCADEVNDCPVLEGVRCEVCIAPLQCNRSTQRCEAPPAVCEDDADCTESQFCDGTQIPPTCALRVPECLDDVFDEGGGNGTPASATPLTGEAFDDLFLCPGDVDWYRVDVEAGTLLTIDARFQQEVGDLELELFLEDGTTLIARARSGTDNERIRVELGTARTLLLRVFPARPTPQAVDYRLVIGRASTDPCQDDALEPNDGPGETSELELNQPILGVLCAADPDYFRLSDVPIGTAVDLELDFVPSLGNLDLAVFRLDEPEPLFVSNSLATTEFISFPATFGGDFIVRVSGDGTDQGAYTLRARGRTGDPAAACPDDPEEPNDGPTTAADVSIPVPGVGRVFAGDRTLCPGDEDWFSVPYPGGNTRLTIELGHDPGIDLDVAVYDDRPDALSEPPLAVGRRTGRREFFTFSRTEIGGVLLRVFRARPQDAGAYELRFNVGPAVPCTDDTFDTLGAGASRNDAVDAGSAPNRLDDLTLCGGDVDFYRVSLPPGFSYEVRLQWPNPADELQLVASGANGFPPTSTGLLFPSATAVTVFSPGPLPLDLFLQPVITAGPGTPYSIVVDRRPGVDCTDDAFDPNDEVAEAATIPLPLSTTGLVLCPSSRFSNFEDGDEDWFEVPVATAGSRLQAEITFEQGDLFLEILSPDGQTRACLNTDTDRCFSDGFGPSERVELTVPAPGPYFLRVSSFYSAIPVEQLPPDVDVDSAYDLEVELTAP
jgi:hypothetical protein